MWMTVLAIILFIGGAGCYVIAFKEARNNEVFPPRVQKKILRLLKLAFLMLGLGLILLGWNNIIEV